jgi:uncharacterized protein YndB with AHSA1/START domain
MNTHERSKITYTNTIAASPEKIWGALTSAAFTQKYWAGRHIVSTWKPGASVQLLNPDGTVDWEGEVLKAAAPRVLSFTFLAPRFEPGVTEPPSRVTIELNQEGSGTRLTLVHDGFSPDSKTCECVSQGWPAILDNLKSWIETGKALDSPAWTAA